eukprot:scaffold83574_cov57-Phaeocystis_antarctica.AAC.2
MTGLVLIAPRGDSEVSPRFRTDARPLSRPARPLPFLLRSGLARKDGGEILCSCFCARRTAAGELSAAAAAAAAAATTLASILSRRSTSLASDWLTALASHRALKPLCHLVQLRCRTSAAAAAAELRGDARPVADESVVDGPAPLPAASAERRHRAQPGARGVLGPRPAPLAAHLLARLAAHLRPSRLAIGRTCWGRPPGGGPLGQPRAAARPGIPRAALGARALHGYLGLGRHHPYGLGVNCEVVDAPGTRAAPGGHGGLHAAPLRGELRAALAEPSRRAGV